MGKGDQRSRRGKIHRGTFGTRRPKRNKSVVKSPVAPVESAPKKTTRKETATAEQT